MRRLVRLAALVLALTMCLPLVAKKEDSATTDYKKGQAAEARNDYVQAYELYKQAYALKPTDMRYRQAYTRMRFYASSQYVHQGQQLRSQGKLQDALADFQKASEIDPSNFVAGQELKRTENIIQKLEKGGAPQPTTLSDLAQEVQGPVELHPISNTPITLRMTEDAKTVYTTIGKLAGLNVLFDPDYNSRRISIELNGVTLYQALEIVALESKTFWRPVTPNTVFVASDSPAKRKELEQSVIKTFYLGNVSSPNDLQDAVNTIRQILDVSRIQQVASQNAIVVRGTPDQIAMAEKVLTDIDKAKPEVVVDVAVMQVTRDKVRNLGISPPTSFSVSVQPNTTTSQTTVTNSNTGNSLTGTTSTGNGTITLNQLANLNANDFQVSIPTATLTALMSDSNTKLLENPQVRALDNQKATLKIGSRVPVATGSFQPGIGGVGINPLVNTQFQYIDVGVNIDITPRIHSDHEVTLKMTLEISSVTGYSTIGGIQQPVIGQQRIEHEIRLKDGEVNLIGGIIEDSQTQSLTGWPGLAQIPILHYLFGQTNKEHNQNEIVFALVPHIVREQALSDLNTQGVDVGTASTIELRHMTPPAPTPVSTTPQGAVQQPGAPVQPVPMQGAPRTVVPGGVPVQAQPQPVPGQPGGIPPGAVNAPPNPSAAPQPNMATAQPSQPATLQAGSTVLSFEPATITQAANSTFVVNVSLGNAQNVYSVPAQIAYDPRILQLVNVSDGGMLGKDGQSVALVHRDDPASGTLQMTATRPPGSGGITGQGPVFTLTFLAKAPGQSTLTIRQASARDPNMQAIPVVGGQAMITVK
jgi:general secretion pathway protein D